MTDAEPAYIDYETFLDPTFSPVDFANSLVRSTNDASDAQLDLSTPLSRVLFDIQEIDTHIHNVSTKDAVQLLTYTQQQSEVSTKIIEDAEAQVTSLTQGYRRLEGEVLQRYEVAEEVRITVERLWYTVKIGRAVTRALLLGRQLETQVVESGVNAGATGKLLDHKAIVRACYTILSLRELFVASGPGEEGEHLGQIRNVKILQSDVIAPSEQKVRAKAQQLIREFSLSTLAISGGATNATSTLSASVPAPTTYAQAEDTKARTTAACLTLYLLSPTTAYASLVEFQPTLLLTALQSYLQTALTSSLAALGRALGTLPTLGRILLEVSARCQNIVIIEGLLEGIRPPPHPLLASDPTLRTKPSPFNNGTPATNEPENLLQPLLSALDTSSLPSYFWRSLASGLSSRVQDILSKGGVSARTLRSQKDKVRDSIRECVLKGCQGAKVRTEAGGWDREAGVMVASVLGPIGR
ncbi:hypothetical protein MMC25_003668 [Agyrium rufum]|nr:hypothetical protein [Agyrium rufum]